MLKVFKYPVPIEDEFCLALPKGAKILSFQVQYHEPQIWALVNPEEPAVDRKFRLAGTGHPINRPYWHRLDYVGTCLLESDRLVLHLFEFVPL